MVDQAYDQLPADSVLAYVRSLIPDMEQLDDPINPDGAASYLFDDATLNRYIAFARGNSPKRAAADACMALAGSELLILKKLSTEDLSTDGAAIAKEHRERATRYRAEAGSDEDADEDHGGIVRAGFPRVPALYDAERIIRSGNRFGRY